MVLQMIQVHLQAVPLLSATLVLPVHQVLVAVLVEIILEEAHLVAVHLVEALIVVHLEVALQAVVPEEVLPVADLLEAVLEELKSKFIDGAIIIFLEI
jgi:hypothetical protein